MLKHQTVSAETETASGGKASVGDFDFLIYSMNQSNVMY